jgi:hypothetical protein
MMYHPFIHCVLLEKILAAKKESKSADTGAYEKQIDRLVYELYGLTSEEIQIVEGYSAK